MNFVGIIAEYDPFHHGHAWQLAAARSMGAQHIAVVLSCGLTQRGALPLLPESVRVRAALTCGADLVFALPAPWACSGAESFARAGVRLLTAAGCDTLLFGAETPDTARLMETARLLLSPEYTAALRQQLAAGARSFAAARQTAAAALCPDAETEALLCSPNNNLALEYCKAILEQRSPLVPAALPRVGALHNGALQNAALPQGVLPPQNGPDAPRFASASALRRLWLENGAAAIAPYVPAAALSFYKEAEAAGLDTDPAAAGLAQLSRLRARLGLYGPQAAFAQIRGISEGLEHRLASAVQQSVTAPELYDALTTVRYPRARMRRLCMDAALGYGGPQAGPGLYALPPLPPYLLLLGARRDALPLLQKAALPAGASLAKLAKQNEDCARTAAAQAAAADFGALCRRVPAPMGLSFTQKPIFLP